MNDQGKTIDEVMEEYNRLHNIPRDVTDSVTHEEFVAGVANKAIGFKVTQGEPITLVRGARKTIFNIVAALYLVVPLLIVPFWAYHESNWWLLVGIPVASLIAPQLRSISFGGLFVLACIVSWAIRGVHSYFTFFSLCLLWGYMFFHVAENAQNEYAMQSLLENPDLFNTAVVNKRILVVRKRDL
ncbi:MAG TPA: hypothetical protein VGJ21_01145 [Terracidiphilus sp.]|jgi:hypothetical protein